ncbi:vacuole morphology and inheritance protein 14 [Marchantia polymorpha subsp. ruderalis]|uniref:Vacuolar protein 14 C-terminal Fig4-binding domain-containing protein n=2 Tax=Marchantia polymorpha TaxID=3197 RepID=A0AAF6BHN5_MARPO|nr:hypothetical protein MARPO_0092s0044 [Marchantia polymorpha]BBN11519.1 hypothetical protein Mp_5g12640 [Marchantia polymorpha subsp. ruderalis]|eukprot:PTQ33082.1 hypothetical protein MARPO_0092s0044 [Marchantia polymorpha]
MNIGGAPLARRGLLGSSVDELWPGRITPSMFFRLITDVFTRIGLVASVVSDTSDKMDTTALLPTSVLRNLSDKLYEKRKNAALEVEGVVKQLTAAGEHEKISGVIQVLTNDFAMSPQANHRKGGLIGLAAATVGLANDASQHLDKIVPPVLNSFTDQDSRVRYYACEALYNIAKVSRGDFIVFFNDIFDALCKLSADSDPNVQSAAHLLDRLVKDIVTESDQFSIEEFIPLLRERMNVLNPFVRQFLVGWITVLDSVPEIDMLGFLPDFLDGLFNMLSDPSHEIRQQADQALHEFLQEIKNAPSVDYGRMAEILVQRAKSGDEFTRLTSITWVNDFVKLGGEQLVPYYAKILKAILPSISDKEEKIRVVARETNEALRDVKASPGDGFEIGVVLEVAISQLQSEQESTRLEALRWISILLERHRTEVLSFIDEFFPKLLDALSDTSDEVVLLVLEVQACIARDPNNFRHLMVFLVHRFKTVPGLLEKRGTVAVRRLCTRLDAEKVYRDFALILEGEADLESATILVQALNLILLTATELSDLRSILKNSSSNPAGRNLFVALYKSWCHSPMATVSLCLLAQAYTHASSIIQSLGELDINVNLLVQVDKLVRLLETPIFAYLRLQLLEPGRYPALLKTLYGLLMLLPQQSSAFKILRTRLKTIPTMNTSSATDNYAIRRTASGGHYAQILSHIPSIQSASQVDEASQNLDSRNGPSSINFDAHLQQFEDMQNQHRHFRVTQSQARKQSQQSQQSQQSRKPPIVPVQNGQKDDISDQRRGKATATSIEPSARTPARNWQR